MTPSPTYPLALQRVDFTTRSDHAQREIASFLARPVHVEATPWRPAALHLSLACTPGAGFLIDGDVLVHSPGGAWHAWPIALLDTPDRRALLDLCLMLHDEGVSNQLVRALTVARGGPRPRDTISCAMGIRADVLFDASLWRTLRHSSGDLAVASARSCASTPGSDAEARRLRARLGTLIVPPAVSAHDRIAAAAALDDAQTLLRQLVPVPDDVSHLEVRMDA